MKTETIEAMLKAEWPQDRIGREHLPATLGSLRPIKAQVLLRAGSPRGLGTATTVGAAVVIAVILGGTLLTGSWRDATSPLASPSASASPAATTPATASARPSTTTAVPSPSELVSRSPQGFFTATGSTHAIGEPDVQAVRLKDGRVLVMDFGDAELYDPTTGTFTVTGPESPARWWPSLTLLPDGSVLVAGGGVGADGKAMYRSADLYNPKTGKFTPTGSMGTARESHTGTLLSNGDVLIAGGDNNTTGTLASAELYDPLAGRFASAGSLPSPRDYHTATLLNDGRVLFTGGYSSFGKAPLAAADLYDPRTGRFTRAGSMKAGRAFGTTTLLADGRVLIAGGTPDPLAGAWSSLASAEVFDPATNEFTPTGSMATRRIQASATLLLDGRVLIAGGWDSNGPKNADGTSSFLASAEIYDPKAGTFGATGSMTVGRAEQAAALLEDGRALIVSGDLPGSTAELYTP